MELSSDAIKLEFIDDRRQIDDRRRQYTRSVFPFVDCDGLHIKSDRRSSPERRISNIRVREMDVKPYIFDSLFA